MTSDTVAIFRQQRFLALESSASYGRLQGKATWNRCYAAVKRLRRCSPAFQSEFAYLLAQSQYRTRAKPPRQVSDWTALRCAWRLFWLDRRQSLSCRRRLHQSFTHTWKLVQAWTGRAWPGALYQYSAQAAIVEAFTRANQREVARGYRRSIPPPAWLAKFWLALQAPPAPLWLGGAIALREIARKGLPMAE